MLIDQMGLEDRNLFPPATGIRLDNNFSTLPSVTNVYSAVTCTPSNAA